MGMFSLVRSKQMDIGPGMCNVTVLHCSNKASLGDLEKDRLAQTEAVP